LPSPLRRRARRPPQRPRRRRAREDWIRRLPDAAEAPWAVAEAQAGVRARPGAHAAERPHVDRLLPPEPAEYKNRKADGEDDGRRLPQGSAVVVQGSGLARAKRGLVRYHPAFAGV